MNDSISRREAIDALKRDEEYNEDIPNRADGVRDAIITISGLPSTQQWISCNDELPEKEDEYFVTWVAEGWTKRFVGIATYYPPDAEDEQYFESGWDLPDVAKVYKNAKILAWAELPDAYEGD